MPIRVMASRHSAFYSPLLCCIRFLRDEGREVTYDVLGAGQRTYALIRDGAVDIVQSAVSSNWKPRERGVEPLPVHFAQINQRDGFFLVGRQPEPNFDWKNLEGHTLLADHGQQPLIMLKYAAQRNGADWKKIKVIDAGTPEKMAAAFTAGTGEYVHLQAPWVLGEAVVSVGASIPPVAFSSLCCARSYRDTEDHRAFLKEYARTKTWIQTASLEDIATAEADFFPQVASGDLTAAAERYRALGCWEGGIEIPRELYEQALNVFQSAGEITWRHWRFQHLWELLEWHGCRQGVKQLQLVLLRKTDIQIYYGRKLPKELDIRYNSHVPRCALPDDPETIVYREIVLVLPECIVGVCGSASRDHHFQERKWSRRRNGCRHHVLSGAAKWRFQSRPNVNGFLQFPERSSRVHRASFTGMDLLSA